MRDAIPELCCRPSAAFPASAAPTTRWPAAVQAEIGRLQQCRFAGAREPDDGGNGVIAGHVTNGVDLLVIELERTLGIFAFDPGDAVGNDRAADPEAAAPSEGIGGLRHGVLGLHDFAGGVDGRGDNRIGLRVPDLGPDGHEVRAGLHLCQDVRECSGIIDEPMHRFGDVALAECGTFVAQNGEHAGRPGLDLSGGLGVLGATRVRRITEAGFAGVCGTGGAEVFGRHDLDPLRRIGSHIDPGVMARQGQMPVGRVGPGQAQVDEFVPVADEVAIDDLAVDADRRTVGIENGDLLVAKATFGHRAQRVHQMDVRIAGHRMHDPIRDHALRRELGSDELAHQRDAFGQASTRWAVRSRSRGRTDR